MAGRPKTRLLPLGGFGVDDFAGEAFVSSGLGCSELDALKRLNPTSLLFSLSPKEEGFILSLTASVFPENTEEADDEGISLYLSALFLDDKISSKCLSRSLLKDSGALVSLYLRLIYSYIKQEDR